MVFAGGCASGSLYKAGEGKGVAMIVILSISVTQAVFVDIGGWFNKLVPDAWRASAIAKKLPPSITVTDGWVDQYLAGYIWNQPIRKFSKLLGMSDMSLQGAFIGDFLVGVVIPATVLLLIVYVFWYRKNYRKKLPRGAAGASSLRQEATGYWSMVMSSKRTAIAGLVLGSPAGSRCS